MVDLCEGELREKLLDPECNLLPEEEWPEAKGPRGCDPVGAIGEGVVHSRLDRTRGGPGAHKRRALEEWRIRGGEDRKIFIR